MKKPYRETQKFAEGGSTRKPGIPLPSDRATKFAEDMRGLDKERAKSAMESIATAASLIPVGRAASAAVSALNKAKTAVKAATKAEKPPVDIKLYERALKNASSKGYGKEGNADIAAKEYERLWKMKEGGKQFRQNSARLARESKPEGMRSGGMVKSGLDGCAIRGKTNGSNR